MATLEKIARLERFITENPALADVPALIVAGRPTTLREALAHLKATRYTTEILTGLRALGVDLPWRLAEEFYRRLSAAYPEAPKIYALRQYVPAMTPTEAYGHVKARDAVGETLVRAYSRMLEFMRVRVNA